MFSDHVQQLITLAIDEDLAAAGDLTSALLPDPARPTRAAIVAREAGVLAGLEVGPLIASAFSRRLDARIRFEPHGSRDGTSVASGDRVAELVGPHAAVLTTERTLLNFLGRLSGVATHTQRYVAAARAANPQVEILDTRKTLPGWRELDKYAVRCGGGTNHRFGLHDAVLLKDNHLAGVPIDEWAAKLTDLLDRIPRDPPPTFIEVEVDTLAQLEQVLAVPGIEIVLLDNFRLEALEKAVAYRDAVPPERRPQLEASGGVTLDTIAAIAATGVDRISVGALTHSAVQLDFGLDLDREGR
jgi:nicotinate-nucleotide pyrophosphorylase (carboxylating)